jgi:hypothetical protein
MTMSGLFRCSSISSVSKRDLYPHNFEGVFDTIRGIDQVDDDLVVSRLKEQKSGNVASKPRDESDDRTLPLSAKDDQWIASTNIGLHFERFRLAILKTAAEVEKSVGDAELTGKNLVLLK